MKPTFLLLLCFFPIALCHCRDGIDCSLFFFDSCSFGFPFPRMCRQKQLFDVNTNSCTAEAYKRCCKLELPDVITLADTVTDLSIANFKMALAAAKEYASCAEESVSRYPTFIKTFDYIRGRACDNHWFVYSVRHTCSYPFLYNPRTTYCSYLLYECCNPSTLDMFVELSKVISHSTINFLTLSYKACQSTLEIPEITVKEKVLREE